VFIGVGAGYPTMLNIPGDSSNGVLSATELLTRCKSDARQDFPNFDTPLPIGKRVAVVGAGNTAMDARACRCAWARRRSTASTALAHEAAGAAEEVHHAEQEG